MTTATDHPSWPTLTMDRAYAAERSNRGERALRRAEFDPALAPRERALGAKLVDRSPERRN